MGYRLLKEDLTVHQDTTVLERQPMGLKLTLGRSEKERWSEEVVISANSPWPPLDWFGVGPMDIVSDRIAKIIQSMEKRVELLPLTLNYRGGPPELRAFCLNTLDHLPVLDLAASEYEIDFGMVSTVTRVVLAPDALAAAETADRALFQVGDIATQIYVVRDDLAELLLQSGMTGMQVVNPEDWRYGAFRD